MRLLLFLFLFLFALNETLKLSLGPNQIREDERFPALTHLITSGEYVLCLPLEDRSGSCQLHAAVTFCSFNPLVIVDQVVLFKSSFKCFYLAFVLPICLDLLL